MKCMLKYLWYYLYAKQCPSQNLRQAGDDYWWREGRLLGTCEICGGEGSFQSNVVFWYHTSSEHCLPEIFVVYLLRLRRMFYCVPMVLMHRSDKANQHINVQRPFLCKLTDQWINKTTCSIWALNCHAAEGVSVHSRQSKTSTEPFRAPARMNDCSAECHARACTWILAIKDFIEIIVAHSFYVNRQKVKSWVQLYLSISPGDTLCWLSFIQIPQNNLLVRTWRKSMRCKKYYSVHTNIIHTFLYPSISLQTSHLFNKRLTLVVN